MSDDKNLTPQEENPTPTPATETTITPAVEPTAPVTKQEEDTSIDAISLEELEDGGNQFGSAHDDFDWELGNGIASPYSDEEQKKYAAEYEGTLSSVLENEIVKGKVSTIGDGDLVLDINYKSDGLLSLSEFRDMPDLKVGDMVEVYVEQQEDDRGQLILSRRKAKLLRAWESIVDSHKNGTIIKGQVVSKTKGGLIVDCGGLETFLPGSQIDIKPIIDYDAYVGKTMEFKVVKVNEVIKNAVVSHKALIESDLAEQRDAIIGSLEKGQVLEGLVKNITDFGAFLDLGGVDGLLYITDISWGRIQHPSEILALNQKINVVVLDFDENKKRISLGLKQLQPRPWEILDASIVEGSTVKGKIVNIEDYGAFLEVQPGVEGLVHVSEVTWSNQPVNARDFFKLGTEYEAKVVTIDRDENKMSLSIKQLSDDPWSKIEDEFPKESRHTGKVKNLTPYGVFVEMKEGIGGMVHISDLSWTKRFSHPSEFTKIGNDIEVVILDIDQNSRKLSLGHKQIEENPWDTFEQVFPVGSYHEATVVRRDDRGAIVQMPYGLEAFAPIKHVRKEDGKLANVDEVLTVKVIEFNRDDKRILVSHLRYLDDIRREADASVRQEKDNERKEVRKSVQKQQKSVQRSTLGELAGFSALKEQLGGETTPPPPPPPKKEEVKETPAAPVAEEVVEEAPALEETVVEETVEAVATPVADIPVVEEVVEEEEEEEEEGAVEEWGGGTNEAATTEAVETVTTTVETDATAEDDLKKIEGVGPKIEGLMKGGGLKTFAQVAAASPDSIKEILLAAGPRYKMHDPTSWPLQAGMAAENRWAELSVWQDEHKGGKM